MSDKRHNGDGGMTVGRNGAALRKSDALIGFAGTMDELNAHLGVVKAMSANGDTRLFIERIQRNIIKLTARVLDPSDERHHLSRGDIAELEDAVERLSKDASPPAGFILPGKNAREAHTHVARAVARRAEREFFAVCPSSACPNAGAYLNRLSDYLFALSASEG